MASREHISVRSPAIEDYAKAIYALELREGEAVSTNALADRLGVTAASASGMVKRLGELGLVEHQPYRGVSLTEDGRRVALEVIRHHRHGDPIPTRDLIIEEGKTQSLQALEPGTRGTFARVSDSDPEMLRFLAERGIAPGDELEVVDTAARPSPSRSRCWPRAPRPRASAPTRGRW